MALPTVSVPLTLTVKEGSRLTIPLTKSGPGACQVQAVTSGNTAVTRKDYVGYEPPWTVKFDGGQKRADISLKTLSDGIDEPAEKMSVYIKNPKGCRIGNGKCVVTIVEALPDTRPRISLPAALTILEGEPLEIPITRTGDGACSFRLKTTGKTALSGQDYEGWEPVLEVHLAADQPTASATLKTLPDTEYEGFQTVTVSIIDPQDCAVGSGSCTVTIEDATPKPDGVDPVEPTDPVNPEDPTDADVESPDPEPDPGPLPDTAGRRFKRAIGFATEMLAGAGKSVYRVTNTNDSGSGSLRDALKSGNRLVVFETSGCIRLKSSLSIDGDNITIAGQTAPGAGITVQSKELVVRASNVRVQHIAFERGHDSSNVGNADVVRVSPGAGSSTWKRSNIHFDHCSFLWSMDETVEIWPSGGNLSNISFSECIFAEPLWRPQKLGYKAHEKVANGRQSEHNYGLIIGYNTKRVDIQNCLFSDMYMRCPFIDHGTSVVINNIVIMNTRHGVTIQQNRSPAPKHPCLVNAQGILMISGPQQNPGASGFRFHSYHPKWPAGSAVCVGPMYGWKAENSSITPGNRVTFSTGQPTQGSPGGRVFVTDPPIQPPKTTVRAMSAEGIYERVLNNAGPRPKSQERCPSVERVINKLRTKKPGWVDHESQVGGFSKYPSVSRRLEDAEMPDGTKIPLPDWSSSASVRKWLDTFNSLVSHD